MTIPKNIFFYWDSVDIPKEASDNVKNYKDNNLDYNVKLLNNNDINKYLDKYTELIKLFHLATIAALKSDIIRMIYLYEEGGMWIDMNTTLLNNDGIKILFNRYNNFDFVINLIPTQQNKITTSALIAKKKSKLVFDIINKMTENLKKHYEIEKSATEYVPYNLFVFVAPVILYDLLEYKKDDNLNFIKDKDIIITLNLPKFNEYKCGLMCVENILKFYGCNMNHHHNENMYKHWSVVQKTQKLFR